MHESFGYPAQLLQFLKVQRDGADLENLRNKSKFEAQLVTWRSNSLHVGSELPRPAVPNMKSVDTVKATERFKQWYEAEYPAEVVFDFFEFTPLELAPGTWDLTPKNVAAPPVDPVAGPDGSIPGQYLVSAGDDFPLDSVIEHPKYGRLKKTGRVTPFGSWYRWVAV